MFLISPDVKKHMELAQKLAQIEKEGKIEYADITLQRLLAQLYIASTPKRQMAVMEKIIEYLDKKAGEADQSTNNT